MTVLQGYEIIEAFPDVIYREKGPDPTLSSQKTPQDVGLWAVTMPLGTTRTWGLQKPLSPVPQDKSTHQPV